MTDRYRAALETVAQWDEWAAQRLRELDAPPKAPAEGLDVARLAQMDYAFWPEDTAHRWCDEDSGGLHRFDVASWAEDFAREYAALTPEDDR